MYKFLLKPILFSIDPEKVHELVFFLTRIFFKLPLVSFIITKIFSLKNPKIETKTIIINIILICSSIIRYFAPLIKSSGIHSTISFSPESLVDHTKGGSSGVVVNQTINVSTGVQQTVRAEIRQMMPQIADSAKGAVLDAKRRGGSYGRAMA